MNRHYPDQAEWRRTLAAMRSDAEVVDELLALAAHPLSAGIEPLQTLAHKARVGRSQLEPDNGAPGGMADFDSTPGVEIIPANPSEDE